MGMQGYGDTEDTGDIGICMGIQGYGDTEDTVIQRIQGIYIGICMGI